MSSTAQDKYIRRRGNSYEVRLPRRILPGRNLGSYDTLEAAQVARDCAIAAYEARESGQPVVDGWTNEDGEAPDPAELWEHVIREQARQEAAARKRAHQTIAIPDGGKPFALAYLSDLHIGAKTADYRALKTDAELIRDTPRLWAGYHGDGINNWIAGRLQALQRDEIVPHDWEIALFRDWLETIGPSLLWVVAGNHDNWTRKLSGLDLPRTLLQGTRVLYGTHQVRFTLVYGARRLRYKVRHTWRGRSVFNDTHQIETGWERGGQDFDVGIGGHTHIRTACRPFGRHGQNRYAVLTGTYKMADDYGEERGFAPSQGRGCGAHVFWGDRLIFCEDLREAVELLERLD